jgi:membrane-associated protein
VARVSALWDVPAMVSMAHSALQPMLLGIDWMDPNWLLDRFGAELFWISILIVFVECGLFFPILPGDTLLFALGLFVATGQLDLFPGPPFVELLIAIAALAGAAFLGNVVGYEIGRRIGPPLYERDGRIIKRKYFDQTTAFFDRHGNKALVIGRFVPFVRTYITVVAGVTRMERHRFFLWSLVGAVMWVVTICLLGFFLGDAFPHLGESIDKLIIVIVAFSLIPIAIEWWRHKRTHAPGADIGPQDGGPDRDITGRDAD